MSLIGPIKFVPIDGSEPMTGDLDMDSNKIINVADPTNDQDAATKSYVDNKVILQGGYDGSVNINSITTHTFTFAPTTLAVSTQYKRTIQFQVRATSNVGGADLFDINWPIGKTGSGETGRLESFLDFNNSYTSYTDNQTAIGLITTDGSGGDSFVITTVATATTSMVVSSMNGMYERVSFA